MARKHKYVAGGGGAGTGGGLGAFLVHLIGNSTWTTDNKKLALLFVPLVSGGCAILFRSFYAFLQDYLTDLYSKWKRRYEKKRLLVRIERGKDSGALSDTEYNECLTKYNQIERDEIFDDLYNLGQNLKTPQKKGPSKKQQPK